MKEHRFGRVSEVDPATCRARVEFDGDEGMVSWWLPVLQTRTGGDRMVWLPDPREFVLCLLDDDAEAGVVLGSVFTAADRPPVAELDRVHVRMRDGAVFEYDRVAHRLSVELPAGGSSLAITVNGDVTLAVPDGSNVFVGGEGGRRLVTEDFVQTIYLTHTHPIPGAPPTPKGTEMAAPNLTRKTRGE